MFPPEPQFQTLDLKPDPQMYVALWFDQKHSFLPFKIPLSDKRKQTSWYSTRLDFHP